MKSISVPFSFTSDTGSVSTTSSISRIAEQHIIDALTTFAGERLMDPRYGASVKNLLFEEMDPLIFAEFRIDAIQDINDVMTVGKVSDIRVSAPADYSYGEDEENTIKVHVQYVVPPFGTSVVSLNISSSQVTLLGGAS
jgi:phage baseplate assembly protein W